MSGERLKGGILHPADLVERLSIREGQRVLCLGFPHGFRPALMQAVGRRGFVDDHPHQSHDVILIWDDEEHRATAVIDDAAPRVAAAGSLWILAKKPGKRPVAGALTVAELSQRLAQLGFRTEVTVSVGPDRYALRFGRRPVEGAPGTTP